MCYTRYVGIQYVMGLLVGVSRATYICIYVYTFIFTRSLCCLICAGDQTISTGRAERAARDWFIRCCSAANLDLDPTSVCICSQRPAGQVLGSQWTNKNAFSYVGVISARRKVWSWLGIVCIEYLNDFPLGYFNNFTLYIWNIYLLVNFNVNNIKTKPLGNVVGPS